MSGYDPDLVRSTYSAIADDYAAMYADGVGFLPVDRELLGACAEQAQALAAELAGAGARRAPVLDVGCGPGQVAAHLAGLGCAVAGVDPAAGMLGVARRRSPTLSFAGGEAGRLPIRTASCAGLVAFWVLHHVPRPGLGAVLADLRRVLVPGAPLLISTHAGAGSFTADGAGGRPVTGTLYADDELTGALTDVGFAVDLVRHRDPVGPERVGDRVYVAATAMVA